MRLPCIDDVCYQGEVNHGSTQLHLSSPPTPPQTSALFMCCLWNVFCLHNSALVEEFTVHPAAGENRDGEHCMTAAGASGERRVIRGALQ